MSDENPETAAIEEAALARIPPWPPQEETGGDDGHAIVVVISEHRRRADKTESTDRIVDFTIDPRRNRSFLENISVRDLPPMSVSVSYSIDTCIIE